MSLFDSIAKSLFDSRKNEDLYKELQSLGKKVSLIDYDKIKTFMRKNNCTPKQALENYTEVGLNKPSMVIPKTRRILSTASEINKDNKKIDSNSFLNLVDKVEKKEGYVLSSEDFTQLLEKISERERDLLPSHKLFSRISSFVFKKKNEALKIAMKTSMGIRKYSEDPEYKYRGVIKKEPEGYDLDVETLKGLDFKDVENIIGQDLAMLEKQERIIAEMESSMNEELRKQQEKLQSKVEKEYKKIQEIISGLEEKVGLLSDGKDANLQCKELLILVRDDIKIVKTNPDKEEYIDKQIKKIDAKAHKIYQQVLDSYEIAKKEKKYTKNPKEKEIFVRPMPKTFSDIVNRKKIQANILDSVIEFIKSIGNKINEFVNGIFDLQSDIEELHNSLSSEEVATASIQLKNYNRIALNKNAKVVQLENGKWQVQSEKGKNLGTYDSEKDAKKRLQNIEFFKHKKAYIEDEEPIQDTAMLSPETMEKWNSFSDNDRKKMFRALKELRNNDIKITDNAYNNIMNDYERKYKKANLNKEAWDSKEPMSEEQQAEETTCKECGKKIQRGLLSGVDRCPECTHKWIEEFKQNQSLRRKSHANFKKEADVKEWLTQFRDTLQKLINTDIEKAKEWVRRNWENIKGQGMEWTTALKDYLKMIAPEEVSQELLSVTANMKTAETIDIEQFPAVANYLTSIADVEEVEGYNEEKYPYEGEHVHVVGLNFVFPKNEIEKQYNFEEVYSVLQNDVAEGDLLESIVESNPDLNYEEIKDFEIKKKNDELIASIYYQYDVPKSDVHRRVAELNKEADHGYPIDVNKCRYCLWFNTDTTLDGNSGYFGKCASCIHAYTEEEMKSMNKDDKKELKDFFSDSGAATHLVSIENYEKKKASQNYISNKDKLNKQAVEDSPFRPGQVEYKRIDLRTEEGIHEAERLKEQGWFIGSHGIDTIDFYRQKNKKQADIMDDSIDRHSEWVEEQLKRDKEESKGKALNKLKPKKIKKEDESDFAAPFASLNKQANTNAEQIAIGILSGEKFRQLIDRGYTVDFTEKVGETKEDIKQEAIGILTGYKYRLLIERGLSIIPREIKQADKEELEKEIIDVEKEHVPTINKIRKDISKDDKLDMSNEDIELSIGDDHLREHKDYYDKDKGIKNFEKELGKKEHLSNKDKMLNKKADDFKSFEEDRIPPKFYPEKRKPISPETHRVRYVAVFESGSHQDERFEEGEFEKEYGEWSTPEEAINNYFNIIAENAIDVDYDSLAIDMGFISDDGIVSMYRTIYDMKQEKFIKEANINKKAEKFVGIIMENGDVRKISENEIRNMSDRELTGFIYNFDIYEAWDQDATIESIMEYISNPQQKEEAINWILDKAESTEDGDYKKASGGTTHPLYTVQCPACDKEVTVTPAELVQSNGKVKCKCGKEFTPKRFKPKSEKEIVFPEMKFEKEKKDSRLEVDKIN